MRKKIATLEVFIDDDVPVSGASRQWDAYTEETRDNYWSIVLNPNEQLNGKKADMLTVFAHELGHFAAQALKTPIAMNDARGQVAAQAFGFRWDMLPETAQAHYLAEKEAWDVARKMNLPLQEEMAKEALATYVRAGQESNLQTAILPESIMRLIEWQTGERLFWDECERTSDSDDKGDELLSEQEAY